MKRKVNLVGKNTLTISLPKKWVEKKNIQKGMELTVNESEGNLCIETNNKKKKLALEIDITGLGCMVHRAITATYKAGMDNVIIHYSTAKELDAIQNILDRACRTYEIIRIDNTVVEVRSTSQLDTENFDLILRKMGHVMIERSKETYEAMVSNNKELMKKVIITDKIIDKQTEFLRRSLNQSHYIKRSHPLYSIVEHSEILADGIKKLNQLLQTQKADKSIIELYETVDQLITHFYKIIYSFDMKKAKRLGVLEEEFDEKIKELCKKPRKDAQTIALLYYIFFTCFELKSALMTWKV